MKTVLLAGGRGTRISEETVLRPKPMIEIGGKPLLWHIMSLYASHGFEDFIIACGYKGDVIKEYFNNFYLHNTDWTINLRDGTRSEVSANVPDWRVELVDTGLDTMTAGRLLRLAPRLRDGLFMVTYGDGVSDVDISALVDFHRTHGRIATVTAVHPPARFGALHIDGEAVREFSEKPQTGEGWINGGFFVFDERVFEFLGDDNTPLERAPLERLSAAGELMAFRHEGFWQMMDTLRDKELLESFWDDGDAPWKVWE